VRSSLSDGTIGRVLFCIINNEMVLLHDFVKKTQKTPPADLALARKRMKEIS
jgi:phage-related protein